MDRPRFLHEKLDAYRAALDCLAALKPVIAELPAGNCDLRDQLRRAGISLLLNIGEGASQSSARERRRFFRIALSSATEVATALDAGRVLGLTKANAEERARQALHRTVALLAALVNALSRRIEGVGGSSLSPSDR